MDSHKFWHFQQDGREFSFTHRDLAQPWRNYLVNDRLQTVLTHTGAGPSHGTRSTHSDYLTPERNPRTVFLRDRDDGTLWHLNGTLGPAPEDWRCTHGFGYTKITATQQKIAGEMNIFLPLDEPLEIWRLKLTSRDHRRRRLQVVPLTLWRLGFRGNSDNTDEVVFEPRTTAAASAPAETASPKSTAVDGFILARCYHWPFPRHRNSYPEFIRDYDRVGFMSASLPVQGFDCMLEPFVGAGSLDRPAALSKNGGLGNRQKRGTPSCGALELHLDLAPGETVELVVLVGHAKDRRELQRLQTAYNQPQQAEEAFCKLGAWWDEYRGRQRIELPDREVAEFANGWNRYALWVRHFNRFGYRDTAQDMVAMAPIDRERGRRRLELMYSAQFQDGWTWHDVDTMGWDHHRSINGDVPAWMPWATAAWARETGDFSLLEKKFPFVDGGTDVTAYDHCKLALQRLLDDSAKAYLGLPRIHSGDWNDCLCGSWRQGVSVWLAQFLVATLEDFAECARRTGREEDGRWMRAEAERLRQTVNQHCWDGRWYVAAFDDDHRPIGSATDRQARIFLNPQTWAVLCGIADGERSQAAMAAVEELMDTPVGIPLLAPPYSEIEERAGLISRIVPGQHHNGGSWNHAVTWAIIAECRIGRPDRALQIYRNIFPPELARRWDLHISEPYVHTSYTNTPLSEETGRTGVGWNTGTVCWIWRTLFEGFAGIDATWDGLIINPSLPREWPKLKLTRQWRGTRFEIEIDGTSGARRNVSKIEVDGKAWPADQPIPAADGPGERKVRVTL